MSANEIVIRLLAGHIEVSTASKIEMEQIDAAIVALEKLKYKKKREIEKERIQAHGHTYASKVQEELLKTFEGCAVYKMVEHFINVMCPGDIFTNGPHTPECPYGSCRACWGSEYIGEKMGDLDL